MKFVIGNGILTDGVSKFWENGAILIEDGKIAQVGDTGAVRPKADEFIDVKGRLILPGFVNFHHHLYSSLAVGISPVGPTKNFVEILQNLWWRLDKALDEESVYFSALAGLIDAVMHGVTTVFDHHASMNFVRGSLKTIEDAFNRLGMKGVLCFEVSDRTGPGDAVAHIDENIEFFDAHRDSSKIKGMMGLHANFTLSDETLRIVAERRPKDMPIHIHCGEDRYDLEFCLSLGYDGVVHRLDRFGLIDDRSILAHAIHLTDRDLEIIRSKDPIIASNPESNANNQVGQMDRTLIQKFVLGTDGMSNDMVQTLRSLYLLGHGHKEDFEQLRSVFFSYRYEAMARFFPEWRPLSVGAPADIVVLEYIPNTPISLENILGHLIFGAKTAKAFMTVVDGQILYHDGKFKGIDLDEAADGIRKAANHLWSKYFAK